MNLSFLLILCDDAQEWGRKNISQLYMRNALDYEFKEVKINMQIYLSDKEKNPILTRIADSCSCNQSEKLKTILENYIKQCKHYRSLFRDGQDTSNRNFEFQRNLTLKSTIDGGGMKEYLLLLDVSTDKRTRVVVKMQNDDDISINDSLKKTLNEIPNIFCNPIENKKIEISI